MDTIAKLLNLKSQYEQDILIYEYNIQQSKKNIKIIKDQLQKLCDHEYIIDRSNCDPHGPTVMICNKCETYK